MLAHKSKGFNFSLTMGSFSFSLDTRVVDIKVADSASVGKKKKTPSNQRRNAKRRQLFLDSKKLTEPNETCIRDSLLVCDICDMAFNSRVELNKHLKKAHESIEQLDVNTSLHWFSTTDEHPDETHPLFTLKDQESPTEIGPMFIKGPRLQEYIDECPELYPGCDFWNLSDDFYADSKDYFRIRKIY